MKKIGFIIAREYISRVRKPSFIILTLLLPVLVGVMLLATILIATKSTEVLHIAVKDDSHLFEDKIRGLDEGESLRFEYVSDTILNAQYWETHYKEEGYDGLLYIPALDLDQPRGITYYSGQEIGYKTEERMTNALQEEIRERVLLRENYNAELLEKLDKEIDLEKVIANKQQYGRSSMAGGIGYICGFLIYIFLIVYGAMVMRGVTEEKSNRIIEVLVTAVRPFELMIGKIIGIGAVGLTQFVLWGILTLGVQMLVGIIFADQMAQVQAMQQNAAAMNSAPNSVQMLNDVSLAFQNLDIGRIIFSFIFYFLFGYFFYAAQFAAIGAAVTDDSDAQSFTFPITIPIIISIILMSVTLDQPFSSAAVWGSMLPFCSPIIMMARIPFHVSWMEQLASMAILIISVILMIWLAARIYRVGILIQGKKVTFKEIGKWIFYKS